MTTSEGATPLQPGSTRSVGTSWTHAPYPAFVADENGGIVQANDAAAALFPGAAPGALLDGTVPRWLAEAHRDLARRGGGDGVPGRPVRGRHGSLALEAHPTSGVDGTVVWWLIDDTDRFLAERALRHEQERTAFLAQASTRLLASLNVQRCMEVAVELASAYLADAAVLIAPAGGRRHPLASCVGGAAARYRTVRVDPAEVPGLSEALQGFPPVPSRWIDPASLPPWAVPDGFGTRAGSAVVTPLPGHGVPAGALILLRHGDREAFDAAEEVFAGLFAARAGAALSAARLYTEQAGITATLMAELLPPPLAQVRGVEFAGGYRPSQDTERIGGDFYDVHPAAEEGQETLAVLGDVCGKGLDAAVLTGKIRNTLHALFPLTDDHERVLRLLNRALLNSRHSRFATLALASVVRRGGKVRLRLTSAGHPPPLIVRHTGEVEQADTRGTLIGALPQVRAVTAHVELAPGETCLLYTDGITEARGGPLGDVLLGEQRLSAALAECAGMPAEAIVERVQMLATEWVGGNPHDDMALLAITAPNGAQLTAVDGRTPGRYTA
ncbi:MULTISPECIES: PP2C family protein-serine/threonine phosphatase [Streptomyces]|uniref:Serine/threonine-protein phosphatase n=1 Tax=Streptomyces sudanensis TaxID=436397 RepID=A0ABY4THT0_9ACTN|nr:MULTISPECIES: PP2C family protein-serine/threonine phosphatase [Streptomyces]URN18469.1 serine/threonine-protein phosphatase [Streptomyces sudanensis]